MNHVLGRSASLALATLILSCPANGQTESWSFDVSTTGEDVSWISPTAVDPAAGRYSVQYLLTLVELDVTWLAFDFTVDVTSLLDPDQQSGDAILTGPAPIDIFSQSIVYPPPPDPPGATATAAIGINADGFGVASITDVTLGTVLVDLGPPFGEQLVDLNAVRITGTVDVTALGPGDVNGDGFVDFVDLVAVLSAWGPCPPPPTTCPADLNGDGEVSFVDLIEVLSSWT